MRKRLLLGSAAVLVVLGYGATAQITHTGQPSGSTAPSARPTTPSSSSTKQPGTTEPLVQNSAPSSGETSRAPSAPAATSQATPPPSSSATDTSQAPAATATGTGTQPNSVTQNPAARNSGTAATNPPPAASDTAQGRNARTSNGAAAQTGAPTPSTQRQPTQPNTNAGTRQETQRNREAPQNAQRNQASDVSLNVQQRTRISQTIARHSVRPLTNVNFSVSVGTAVPRSVRLNPLPADLATVVPQYRGYSYFVVEEQIVIVEPSSTQIVAVIPYSGGNATRTAAPAPTKSRAVKLSTQEREVVRRHTSRRTDTPAAPLRRASRHYSIGDEVETTETIETFPETVYREAPSVRPYRYFRRDNNVILVDPEDHRVVDIFD
ncbi:MAG: hypothetical protein V7608_2768 [Hyphomicrobiales bacterium]